MSDVTKSIVKEPRYECRFGSPIRRSYEYLGPEVLDPDISFGLYKPAIAFSPEGSIFWLAK
ncbi:hypothetical protein CEQ90_10335 [Lewinellaceae bacterium SD302]|nr:hypothetical protein CEQ90_10335 [Lewinellaceae bacterium SD302]